MVTLRNFWVAGLLGIFLSNPFCGCSPRPNAHVAAANLLTQRYATSRFAAWRIRATARGNDCSVLVLQTSIILEDSMIEAMHYGAGSYDTYDGGMQQFTRDHRFRGVAYKDISGKIWTYGPVSRKEAEAAACH
jgi:hypothetical protein